MVVCLAAQVLCRWRRMALCRRSEAGVDELYSKAAMGRRSCVWSCGQSTAGVVVPRSAAQASQRRPCCGLAVEKARPARHE